MASRRCPLPASAATSVSSSSSPPTAPAAPSPSARRTTRRSTSPPTSATTTSSPGSSAPASGRRRSTTSSSSRPSARSRCCAPAPTSTPPPSPAGRRRSRSRRPGGGGRRGGAAAFLVLEAAKPWSRKTHKYFPAAARARAVELWPWAFRFSRQPRGAGDFDVRMTRVAEGGAGDVRARVWMTGELGHAVTWRLPAAGGSVDAATSECKVSGEGGVRAGRTLG